MDDSLCERLPEHLVEKILSRLPIRDIFCVRAVCHRWNSLVSCPGFALLRAREGVPSEGPWFLMLATDKNPDPDEDPDKVDPVVIRVVNEADQIAAYYHFKNEWNWIRQPTTTMLDPFDIVSSDGGLICYYNYNESIILVVNPLTNAYRRLPDDPVDFDVDSMCLVVDRVRRSYQVILIGGYTDETTFTTDVALEAYHSLSDSWSRLSAPLHISGRIYPFEALHASGCLYLFNRPSSQLLEFNLVEHVWRRIDIPFLNSVHSEHAVQWQERLLIIADEMYPPEFVSVGICVWELHRATSIWVLVDKMPDYLFQEFGEDVHTDITYVADCSLVLLTKASSNEGGSSTSSVNSFKTVLYDLEKKAWTMVEGCPFNDLDVMSFASTIGYKPRLDAMV